MKAPVMNLPALNRAGRFFLCWHPNATCFSLKKALYLVMFPKKKTLQRTSPLTADELLSRMEQFCAYRERCPKEVLAKMKALGAEHDVAQQVYDVLETDNFFNEQRFALAYAGGKFRNNHWGRVRIRLELRSRDVSPAAIQEALDAIDMDAYEATLLKLLEKKLSQYAGDDKARAKTAASLIRAGYEPELVFRYLNADGSTDETD